MINFSAIRAFAFAAICAMPALSQAAVTPEPLPDCVTAVQPAQGYIDTSNNLYPLGAGFITIVFDSEPMVNEDCEGLISIYVDNAAEPSESLEARSSVSVDAMGFSYGSVKFSRKYADPGTYHISIAEGAWLLNGLPSPAIELNYEIRSLQTLSPNPGIVDQITGFVMTVAGNNVVRSTAANKQPELYRTGPFIEYGLDISYEPNILNPDYTDIVMRITSESGSSIASLSDPGDYTLLLPGGCFTFDVTDSYGNVTTQPLQETVASYTISDMPKPIIYPEEFSVLKSFSTFEISYPDGFELWFTDNMGGIYLYPVKNGQVSSSYAYRLSIVEENETGLTLGVLNSDFTYVEGEEYTPANGTYALRLRDGLFTGTYNGNYANCPAFVYYFDIYNEPVAVDTIQDAPEAEFCNIYSITGTVVARNCSRDRISSLPAGLYIVNGKKIMVK